MTKTAKVFKINFELYNAAASLHRLDENLIFVTNTLKINRFELGLLTSK